MIFIFSVAQESSYPKLTIFVGVCVLQISHFGYHEWCDFSRHEGRTLEPVKHSFRGLFVSLQQTIFAVVNIVECAYLMLGPLKYTRWLFWNEKLSICNYLLCFWKKSMVFENLSFQKHLLFHLHLTKPSKMHQVSR